MGVLWGFMTLLMGCGGPPEAPADYESLQAYIFGHMDDADPEALALGVEELAEWMESAQNLEESLKGLQLTRGLEQEVVDGLDGSERSVASSMGISFAFKSPHGVEKVAKTLVWDGFENVMDHLPLYERIFDPGYEERNCFHSRDCDWLSAKLRVEADWSILGVIESKEVLQYRWVETLRGWTLLQRSWLEDAVYVSSIFGDVELEDIYTLVIYLPNDGLEGMALDSGVVETASGLQGGAVGAFDSLYRSLCSPGVLRVESRWMKAAFPMSDEQALEQTMDSAKSDATKVDEWISENYEEVTPRDPPPDEQEGRAATLNLCGDEGLLD